MNLVKFLDTWSGVQAENRVHRRTNLILAVVCLITAIGWTTRHETVVMLPPALTKEASLGVNVASEEIKVQWGLYAAQLLGNVTPATAGFLRSAIGPMLAPHLYHQVMEAIDEQVKQVQQEQIAIHFAPTSAVFNPDKNRVVVSGELATMGLRGEIAREQRTYEFSLVVQNYKVILDDLRVYKGPPQVGSTGDHS
ncbi:MAG TPA: TraE/TraK family type IV conjugative transfer system protein [Rhodanobacteraceae bacterium]|nr:TraE/TraK family type IV conjugative transfer system protein [Rhodanobacteraceae bacterium]